MTEASARPLPEENPRRTDAPGASGQHLEYRARDVAERRRSELKADTRAGRPREDVVRGRGRPARSSSLQSRAPGDSVASVARGKVREVGRPDELLAGLVLLVRGLVDDRLA